MPTLRDAVQTSAALTQLLLYDSVWTSRARDRQQIVEHPFELLDIAQGFRRAISAAPRRVRQLAQIAETVGFDSLPDGLRAALSSEEDGRVALDALEQHDGHVATLAHHAAIEIADYEKDELDQLESDIRSILEGEVPAGHFGKYFLCGLAMASMAAGLIVVWVPPHAHAVPAVSLGVTVYKTNKCGKTRTRSMSKEGSEAPDPIDPKVWLPRSMMDAQEI